MARAFGTALLGCFVAMAWGTFPTFARQPEPLAGSALRHAVGDAVARAAEGDVDASVRELVTLHDVLVADKSLAPKERSALRASVRHELELLRSRIQACRVPSVLRSSPQESILAQPGGGPLGALGAPPAPPPMDHSQELMDLIQATIAPATWESLGGPGVIRYWQPGHALVIRQTTEVHEDLQRLLRDLR